ncbi:Chitooligosaccharidolytic beta-N-acetylglucosaminidase [Orchesella cincta]|uniref:beta-N-acetylhexosaminidase n=1 Tax=Orchesella cincta TaxID=48709 RepID=A0A1D2MDR2_ORCCI|nr:Chitooligosaccharidolytic beta-N-acetylglucosaminidase [Orchesella cincta]
MARALFLLLIVIASVNADIGELPPDSYLQKSPWAWVCKENTCAKVNKDELEPTEDGYPLSVCKLSCGEYGALFPKPTGKVEIGKGFVQFYPQNLKFSPVAAPSATLVNLTGEASKIFTNYLNQMHPDYKDGTAPFPSGTEVDPIAKTVVLINIAIAHPYNKLELNTNEGYLLSIQKQDDMHTVLVTITANTFFGARHGLETLSQLIAYNDDVNSLQIVDQALIRDKPVFKYRGVILDTSRNFISVSVLKKLIDGMSYNKLNMFHWHITDSHSFPFYSKSVPLLTKYGAYSPRQIYTIEDMKDLVEYARVRGVKIIPEFDAPAHAGNGWQWGPKEGKGDMAVCINQEPWQKFCVEPPCGQLNPVNENMYEILGKIYLDMLEIFDNDLFHMGGDEVNLQCWNETAEIRKFLTSSGKDLSQASYIGLWNTFQQRALKLLRDNRRDESKNLTAILWTSDLVSKKHLMDHVDKNDYIVQIWTTGNDEVIPFLLDNGYRTIFSNYDAWYFDCGYGAWVGGGPNNWCSPYKGWQQVYQNSPQLIYANVTSASKATKAVDEGLILGGEAAMWSEQVDGTALESKIFPRASALAERLLDQPDHWMVCR